MSATPSIETKHLKLVAYAPEHLRALMKGSEDFVQSFGWPLAEGLRDFYVSKDVSPDLVGPAQYRNRSRSVDLGFRYVAYCQRPRNWRGRFQGATGSGWRGRACLRGSAHASGPRPRVRSRPKPWWLTPLTVCALWQEAIVRSGTVSSSAFTLPDRRAAYTYFQAQPEINGFFPVAVAIQAWQLALEGAQPRNRRRRVYHIPHSLDPRQFLGSMHSGKIEAEVGLFVEINGWETLRWWFTESELVYWGLNKASIPILALGPDQLWEYDPDTPTYYLDRHRELPPEVAAVVNQRDTAAATEHGPGTFNDDPVLEK